MNQAGERRRRAASRRRRTAAAGFTVALVALLVLGFLGLPLRSARLKARIVRELENLTASSVQVEAARLSLLSGRVHIRNVQVANPDPGAGSFTVGSADLRLAPVGFLLGRGLVRSVELSAPSPIELERSPHGIVPAGNSAFLRNAIDRAFQRKNGGDRVPEISIRGASVIVRDRQTTTGDAILPGLGAEPMRLHGVDLKTRRTPAGELEIDFSGALETHGHSTAVQGHAAVSSAGRRWRAGLQIPRILLGGESDVAFDGIDVRLDAAREQQRVQGSMGLTAQAVTMRSRGGTPVRDESIRVDADVALDLQTRTLAVSSLRCGSAGLSAEMSGAVSGAPQYAYDIRVDAPRVGRPYQEMFRKLLPSTFSISGLDDSFSLSGAASGDRSALASMVGKLTFTSASLQLAALGSRPLEDVHGELNFEPNRLVLHQATGTFGRTELVFDGDITGDYLRAKEGLLKLEWKARAAADDLMFLMGAQQARTTREKTTASTGAITGTGEYSQFVSLIDSTKTSEPDVTGTVELRNVALSHPALPARVTGLEGTLRIRGPLARIEKLRGTMEGNELTVAGVMGGKRLFWNDPFVTATLTTKLDLGRLVKYLPTSRDTDLAAYGITGTAESVTNWASRMADLGSAEFSGRARLQNVSFDPHLQNMTGKFTEVNASANWDGHALTLESFTGRLNGEPVTALGLLSPEEISLKLQSRMDLGSFTSIFPRMQRVLEMSGPAVCDLSFRVTEAAGPGAAPAVQQGFGGRLMPLLQLVADRIDQAVDRRAYALDGKVTFGVGEQGANIRHRGMPIARTTSKGEQIPRGEILSAFGDARIAPGRFTISREQPVRCDFSDSKNCRLSGEIEFRQDNLPRIDFNLEVDGEGRLDTWALGWGKELQRPPSPPPSDRTFEMVGRIRMRSSAFRGEHGGPMSGVVQFIGQQNRPRVTQLSDVRLTSWGGSLTGEGRIESFPWAEPGQYPRWQASGDVRQMQLAPLLVCLFPKAEDVDGIVSARVQLQGTGKTSRTIRGSGSASLSRVTLSRTPLMQRLGQTTGHSFEGLLFDTASTTRFTVADGAISTPEVVLQTRGVKLEMHGNYYFDRRIEAMMRINFFTTIVGDVPLIGELAKLADRAVGNLLLAFRVSGTTTNPRITPVALPLFQGAETLNVP